MSPLQHLWLPLVCFAVTALGVNWLRRHALSTGLMDLPNARSSHTNPTPRGGGLAFVLVICAVVTYLGLASQLPRSAIVAIAVAGFAVAAVGYADDHFGLSARFRATCHLLAAALALYAMGGWQAANLASSPLLGYVLQVVALLAIAWMLNLFNFMDGIDGIAASEAIFVTLAAAGLVAWSAGFNGWVVYLLAFAAACIGFLLWNWPAAKIFMGDVGSGFLGFTLAVTGFLLDHAQLLSVWTFMTLNSLFIADASATLISRLARGERFHEAHRSHAYQRLARTWGSHLKVTRALWLLNIVLVLPLATFTVIFNQAAPWLATAVVVLFGCAVLVIKRRDDRRQRG